MKFIKFFFIIFITFPSSIKADLNQELSEIWPNITEAKEPMPNHQEWKEKENKIDVLILE